MKAVAKEHADDAEVVELRSKRTRTEETPVEPVLELKRPSSPPIELRVRRDGESVRPEVPRPTLPEPVREPGSLRASAPPKPQPPRRTSTVPSMPAPPSAGLPTAPVAPARNPSLQSRFVSCRARPSR